METWAHRRPRHGRTADEPIDASAIQRLVDRVAQGDRGAYVALYDHIAVCVYGLALRSLRDPGEAERAATQALVAVWREAPRFDATHRDALSWILAISYRSYRE